MELKHLLLAFESCKKRSLNNTFFTAKFQNIDVQIFNVNFLDCHFDS